MLAWSISSLPAQEARNEGPKAAIEAVVRHMGLTDVTEVDDGRKAASDPVSRTVEIRFLKKEGFRLRDFMRFLQAVEAAGPGLQIIQIDLGRRDPTRTPTPTGELESIWRPMKTRVWQNPAEAAGGPPPATALSRLEKLVASLAACRVASMPVDADRLEIDRKSATWNLGYQDFEAYRKLESAVQEQFGAVTMLQGKTTERAGGPITDENARVFFDFSDPLVQTAKLLREAIRLAAPDGNAITVVHLRVDAGGPRDRVAVTLLLDDVHALGRLVSEIKKIPELDGLVLDRLSTADSGRLSIEARVRLR